MVYESSTTIGKSPVRRKRAVQGDNEGKTLPSKLTRPITVSRNLADSLRKANVSNTQEKLRLLIRKAHDQQMQRLTTTTPGYPGSTNSTHHSPFNSDEKYYASPSSLIGDNSSAELFKILSTHPLHPDPKMQRLEQLNEDHERLILKQQRQIDGQALQLQELKSMMLQMNFQKPTPGATPPPTPGPATPPTPQEGTPPVTKRVIPLTAAVQEG
jgi:hypothetical protein